MLRIGLAVRAAPGCGTGGCRRRGGAGLLRRLRRRLLLRRGGLALLHLRRLLAEALAAAQAALGIGIESEGGRHDTDQGAGNPLGNVHWLMSFIKVSTCGRRAARKRLRSG
jgi:hypothetical protein